MMILLNYITCDIINIMTIYDIAKEAGVSASTVSRVINNKKGIKESTRRCVQEILDRNNFSVSETARGLVNRKAMMIGILISDIRYQHFADGAYIIEEQFLQKGFCSLIFNTGFDDVTRANYIKLLASRRVDGVILIGSGFCTDAVKRAILSYMPTTPVVIANGLMDIPTVSSVIADEVWGVGELVERLYRSGRRKIIYIGDKASSSSLNKYKGYEDTVQGLGLESIFIEVLERNADAGYTATRDYFSTHGADAIIYGVDILAVGGSRALLDLGLEIPKDVALYGIDNSMYASIANPKISSLDTKLELMSILCAEKLANSIDGMQMDKITMIMPDIVDRETTERSI